MPSYGSDNMLGPFWRKHPPGLKLNIWTSVMVKIYSCKQQKKHWWLRAIYLMTNLVFFFISVTSTDLTDFTVSGMFKFIFCNCRKNIFKNLVLADTKRWLDKGLSITNLFYQPDFLDTRARTIIVRIRIRLSVCLSVWRSVYNATSQTGLIRSWLLFYKFFSH